MRSALDCPNLAKQDSLSNTLSDTMQVAGFSCLEAEFVLKPFRLCRKYGNERSCLSSFRPFTGLIWWQVIAAGASVGWHSFTSLLEPRHLLASPVRSCKEGHPRRDKPILWARQAPTEQSAQDSNKACRFKAVQNRSAVDLIPCDYIIKKRIW